MATAVRAISTSASAATAASQSRRRFRPLSDSAARRDIAWRWGSIPASRTAPASGVRLPEKRNEPSTSTQWRKWRRRWARRCRSSSSVAAARTRAAARCSSTKDSSAASSSSSASDAGSATAADATSMAWRSVRSPERNLSSVAGRDRMASAASSRSTAWRTEEPVTSAMR